MRYTCAIEQLKDEDIPMAGGKAVRLAAMHRAGVRVPGGICVTTEAYRQFMETSGLQERVLLELNRKPLDQMRWEEIWDAALRIRHMFQTSVLPEEIQSDISKATEDRFAGEAVVVRSSSLSEDSAKASFAGLHESFINVKGPHQILDRVRLVWASLWSDRAILYRKELGLDVNTSAMAVVVQPLLASEVSGIAFGRHPLEPEQIAIEAVYGMNQGLVDGDIEPDRWALNRKDGSITEHKAPSDRWQMVLAEDNRPASEKMVSEIDAPPLSPPRLQEVFELSLMLERLFGEPQDAEWTYAEGDLWALQSRPITRSHDQNEDKRPWYLSLHRSFENLKRLQETIEGELLPGMEKEAAAIGRTQLETLTDEELAAEMERRENAVRRWTGAYWEYCIPFAHGIRLFGQIYNDTLQPDDPFEFVELLAGEAFLSMKRNAVLTELAEIAGKDPEVLDALKQGRDETLTPRVRDLLRTFLADFGATSPFAGLEEETRQRMVTLLDVFSQRSEHEMHAPIDRKRDMTQRFVEAFEPQRREWALELLDLARASYRLRDDDNVYLSKIEGPLVASKREATLRLAPRGIDGQAIVETSELTRALRDKSYCPRPAEKQPVRSSPGNIRPRQLVGQPASRGMASARARVVLDAPDLFSIEEGDIIVCDAISPDMTFAVPLVTGIVERRGGMLIHGAIIAREYDIPCVTGIADATDLIHTGDWVTIDGYLGIVTVTPMSDSSGPLRTTK